MASPSQLEYSLLPSVFYVGPGISNAVFVDVYPGQIGTMVKYLSGGTLELLPPTVGISLPGGGANLYSTSNFRSGSTQTAAMLSALSGTGYPMGLTEALNLSGPARFYLNVTGATTQVAIIRSLQAGV